MASNATSAEMSPDEAIALLKNKKEAVRAMKKKDPNGAATKAAIKELKELQTKLASLVKTAKATVELPVCNRTHLDQLLGRRMFIVPSFDIYGGVKGLYDFGPPACALKANFLNLWRQHFVLEENMLEVDCTNMTPHKVLETSGHVERFTDLMVKDMGSGECLRADHLLEKHIDTLLEDIEMPTARRDELNKIRAQADAFSPKELHGHMNALGIVDSEEKPFGEPFPFNLMFKTSIGPEGTRVGYLRPETAQGIFVNFKKLLEYNSGKMPFAAAQIGVGFRNEIAPRSGLLRVREFPMAEIEHFVNPEQKDHPKFASVSSMCLPLYPQANQLGDQKTLKTLPLAEAVTTGVVNNETLAYFMARTYLFLVKVGIKPTHIRFRQHLKSEMAHYASDCWDAEIYLTYGWIECVGIADRSCFDLTMHAKAAKVDMRAEQRFKEKQMVRVAKIKTNNKLLGKTFKRDQKVVKEALAELEADAALAMDEKLNSDGKFTLATCGGEFELTREMISSVKVSTKGVDVIKYLPGVIEPSFGVGRILYSIMEHAFYTRQDDVKKGVMAFKVCVCPVKCSVFGVSHTSAEINATIAELASSLTSRGISSKRDSSGVSIGKRYARTDEIGIPFAITVDFDTVKEESDKFKTVTLRERDSRDQIRVQCEDVAELVSGLVFGRLSWADACEKYPKV